jgi:hypothetical protein
VVVSFSAPDPASWYVIFVQQSVAAEMVHAYELGMAMSTVVHNPFAVSGKLHGVYVVNALVSPIRTLHESQSDVSGFLNVSCGEPPHPPQSPMSNSRTRNV